MLAVLESRKSRDEYYVKWTEYTICGCQDQENTARSLEYLIVTLTYTCMGTMKIYLKSKQLGESDLESFIKWIDYSIMYVGDCMLSNRW